MTPTINEQELREHSKMSLFNLYLDDVTKLKAIEKMKNFGIDTKKGSLSALIRVLLNRFVEEDNFFVNSDICDQVRYEYNFTTKKNKRSTL